MLTCWRSHALARQLARAQRRWLSDAASSSSSTLERRPRHDDLDTEGGLDQASLDHVGGRLFDAYTETSQGDGSRGGRWPSTLRPDLGTRPSVQDVNALLPMTLRRHAWTPAGGRDEIITDDLYHSIESRLARAFTVRQVRSLCLDLDTAAERRVGGHTAKNKRELIRYFLRHGPKIQSMSQRKVVRETGSTQVTRAFHLSQDRLFLFIGRQGDQIRRCQADYAALQIDSSRAAEGEIIVTGPKTVVAAFARGEIERQVVSADYAVDDVPADDLAAILYNLCQRTGILFQAKQGKVGITAHSQSQVEHGWQMLQLDLLDRQIRRETTRAVLAPSGDETSVAIAAMPTFLDDSVPWATTGSAFDRYKVVQEAVKFAPLLEAQPRLDAVARLSIRGPVLDRVQADAAAATRVRVHLGQLLFRRPVEKAPSDPSAHLQIAQLTRRIEEVETMMRQCEDCHFYETAPAFDLARGRPEGELYQFIWARPTTLSDDGSVETVETELSASPTSLLAQLGSRRVRQGFFNLAVPHALFDLQIRSRSELELDRLWSRRVEESVAKLRQRDDVEYQIVHAIQPLDSYQDLPLVLSSARRIERTSFTVERETAPPLRLCHDLCTDLMTEHHSSTLYYDLEAKSEFQEILSQAEAFALSPKLDTLTGKKPPRPLGLLDRIFSNEIPLVK